MDAMQKQPRKVREEVVDIPFDICVVVRQHRSQCPDRCFMESAVSGLEL